MSGVSNLQRQIASLHGGNRSATYATTNHELVIGRGPNFNNEAGHSSAFLSSAKSKPSVLYKDCKVRSS